MPEGHFWYSSSHMDKNDPTKYLALSASRLNTIVVDLIAPAGYPTNRDPKSEEPKYKETETRLAGHFLRGNAASTAYYLSLDHGASWGVMHGIDRARHSVNSFFASYARGVCKRLAAAFDSHPHRIQLQFEGAARL